MTYAKVPLPCSDYAFGIQDFNKVAANSTATAAVLTPQHGYGNGPTPWHSLGHHNDDLVSRSVGRFTVGTRGTANILVRQLSGPAVKSVTRSGEGDYILNVQGLSEYNLMMRPEGDDIGQLRVIVPSFTAASRTGPAYYRLQLFEQVVATDPFVVGDYDFCFSIWGET